MVLVSNSGLSDSALRNAGLPDVAGSDSSPLLRLDRVWRTMEAEPPVHAVRDVSLTVKAGDWWSIMGPSGSGKSTLLNLIGCLDRPTQGTYSFLGTDVGSLTDAERAGIRAANIGFVFQQFHLLSHRTAVENVMLSDLYVPIGQRDAHGGRFRRAERRARAVEALDRVGLAQRADFLPSKLSGGERQRVAIARALMNEPPLLICDEPTGNLDSANTRSVLDLVSEIHRQGQSIIVVTHEDDVAERGEYVARMIDGMLSVDPSARTLV